MKTSEEKRVGMILRKIGQAEEKLCASENNLQFIKALKSLRLWLERFADILPDGGIGTPYAANYDALFLSGSGWSFYSRVCNSIDAYHYGERPF